MSTTLFWNFPMVESTIPQPIDPSPSSSSDIFPNSQTTPAPQTSDNVYSEFHRISELFHTAFAKGIQNCDGVVLDPESAAIIAVEESKQKQLAEVAKRKKYPQRSNELIRVTDLNEEDHSYFREVVRKTRMLYDAIQIISVAEEDKKNPGLGKQEKAEREKRKEKEERREKNKREREGKREKKERSEETEDSSREVRRNRRKKEKGTDKFCYTEFAHERIQLTNFFLKTALDCWQVEFAHKRIPWTLGRQLNSRISKFLWSFVL